MRYVVFIIRLNRINFSFLAHGLLWILLDFFPVLLFGKGNKQMKIPTDRDKVQGNILLNEETNS